MSWHTAIAVRNPRVMVGTPDDGLGQTVAAETVTYRDGASSSRFTFTTRVTALTRHRLRVCRLSRRRQAPNTAPCAPRREAGPRCGSPASVISRRPRWMRCRLRVWQGQSRIASRRRYHDRCRAVGAPVQSGQRRPVLRQPGRDRVRTWSDWFENNSRSARYRPWMPAAGNHENELGNGPIGYGAYQTYFALPDSGSDPELRGLWYAFTAGSVRVISLQNDDICYQDGGNSYVRGYSGGAQKRWLEQNSSAHAATPVSTGWWCACTRPRCRPASAPTAPTSASARTGCRCSTGSASTWWSAATSITTSAATRSAGTLPTDTLTPMPVDTQADLIDTSKGTVHLVIGGGGTSIPSNSMLFPEPRCGVLTGVGGSMPLWDTRFRTMSRSPRHGRRFVTWRTRAASSYSTSTLDNRAERRRSPRRTTRSTARSAESLPSTSSR